MIKNIIVIIVVLIMISSNSCNYNNISNANKNNKIDNIKVLDSIKNEFEKECNVETSEIVFSR